MARLQDPDLGYTQGMCFAAAVVCLGTGDLQEKQQRFSKLMSDLRPSAKIQSSRKKFIISNTSQIPFVKTDHVCFRAVCDLHFLSLNIPGNHALTERTATGCDLWLPGFPLVRQGVPALESMLASKDPELLHHLYHTVKLAPG